MFCVRTRMASARAARLALQRSMYRHVHTAFRRGYGSVTAADVSYFRSVVGSAHVIDDSSALLTYNTDWMRKYHGRSRLCIRPGRTEDVQAVLAHCHARQLPIVPQGGNTGLVGGSVPLGDEIVLSLSRMAAVTAFDPSSGAIVCEAGCVLQALDAHLAPHGWTVPLDLGAKGSCQIGGNVSTNAGGLRLLRYGSMHANVLGLTVVAADGRLLDFMSTLRKDNVGYDLKQLFIGAEGTLGVVTHVALQAAPRPTSVNVAMFAVHSFPAAVALVKSARGRLGEILSALEFVDAATMRITTEQLQLRAPFEASPALYVVIETAGSVAAHDEEKLHAFLEAATAEGLVQDGVVAQDSKQAAALWRLREDASVAVGQRGHVYKYDLSFPLPRMYDLVDVMRLRLHAWEASHGVQVVGYGHLGDGNVHLNISTPNRGQDYHAALGREIEPFVLDWTLQHGGSISAEHGLGVSKSAWLGRAKPAATVAIMRQMKALLDPHNILNPGKLLGSEEEHEALRSRRATA